MNYCCLELFAICGSILKGRRFELGELRGILSLGFVDICKGIWLGKGISGGWAKPRVAYNSTTVCVVFCSDLFNDVWELLLKKQK